MYLGSNRTDDFRYRFVVLYDTLIIILFIPRPRKIFLGRVFCKEKDMRRSGYALPEAIMGVILVTLVFTAGIGVYRLVCTVLGSL